MYEQRCSAKRVVVAVGDELTLGAAHSNRNTLTPGLLSHQRNRGERRAADDVSNPGQRSRQVQPFPLVAELRLTKNAFGSPQLSSWPRKATFWRRLV